MSRKAFQVNFTTELLEELHSSALAHDLNTSSYIMALCAGALRRGTADRLVMEAIDRDLVPVKRANRPQNWTSVGKGGYLRGEYALERVGKPGGHPVEGDGWYVEGPGLERTFVGEGVREARQNADVLVERAMKKETCPC